MTRIHRWIIAVLLMLCLPLQGMAAIALPLTMVHETPEQVSVQQDSDTLSDHCMQHASSDAQPEQSAPTCDNCFTCHLSVAQALMPALVVVQPGQPDRATSLSPGEKIALLTFPFFRPPISS